MKSMLIVSHAMEIGGAERSLIGLLNSIDYSEYKVDLFLLRHTGEFMSMIPEKVNLLPLKKQYSFLATPIVSVIKQGGFLVALGRIIGKFKAQSFIKKSIAENGKNLEACGVGLEYSHKYTAKFMPKISDKKYDIALSFLTPHYFVRDKVDADKKLAWIHTDYTVLTVDTESETKMWSAYDNIVGVSEQCSERFVEVFPELKDKVTVIENILSQEFVREQAEMEDVSSEIPKSEDGINIVSVGRFEKQKNFSQLPAIISKLDLPIKWYLVGYGGQEAKIREKIKEYNVEDKLIILGKKTNPYPYMKACDIYAQLSLYEGKAVTVREAQMLYRPVVITDYPTAHSQINDGTDGKIIPLEIDACVEKLREFILDKELQKKISNNCKELNFGNEEEIEKIYDIIR